jgi:hypothetical protein
VGPTRPADVTHAVLRTRQITDSTDLIHAATQLGEQVDRLAQDPSTHVILAGINPTTWQSVEFRTASSVNQNCMTADDTQFTVLHISQPTSSVPS